MMYLSCTVSDIFNVEEWRDLECRVMGYSRSLKVESVDRPYTPYCQSATVL